MKLLIYGAQGYALGAYLAMNSLYPKRVIHCFLVTRMEGNASVLGDIPVRRISDYASGMTEQEKHNTEVLIATPDMVQPEIEEVLENYGFPYHRRLDSHRWSELMMMYHIKQGTFLPLSALPVGYHAPFVRIYLAKSHLDKQLKNEVHLPSHIFPIQVGAVMTPMRLADLTDDQGDNISWKNPNYSELTALYWMWKNKLCIRGEGTADEKQYFGLAQYRRMFAFSEDDMLRIADNDVDAVLPYPLPYEPNILSHYKRYVRESDWEAVMRALQEVSPEYTERFEAVLHQSYLYNYNVLLAKKSVLRDYCAWLFAVLEKTELYSDPKGEERADRYLGYLGETLETLYFMGGCRKELNLVHTECELLI